MSLSGRDIGEIVMMRGLGYNQAEIAQRLGVSQSAIQYQLARINERARKEGDDDTFLALVIGFLIHPRPKGRGFFGGIW